MMRALATSTFAVGLILLGCTSTEKNIDPPGGSSGGADGEGGAGGSPSASGGAGGKAQSSGGSGGSFGSGGSGAAGGSSGTGGAGGGAGAQADSSAGGSSGAGDGDAAADAPKPADAPAGDARAGDGGVTLGGEVVPSRPWIHLCPKSWTQTQCCELLCACLNAYCTDSPLDKPRIPGCMSMCMGLTDFRARCQVYHCFESMSPTAVKDHASHCGHASGRVGGGSCTIIQQQQ